MRLDGQRHAPASLPPGKRTGTHFIGGWLGPRVSLDGCGKSRFHRDSIPGPSIPLLKHLRNNFFRILIVTRDSALSGELVCLNRLMSRRFASEK